MSDRLMQGKLRPIRTAAKEPGMSEVRALIVDDSSVMRKIV
jgi:hypothetical protein